MPKNPYDKIKKKRGPAPMEIDLKLLEELRALRLDDVTIVALMGISQELLTKRKREQDPDFMRAYEGGIAKLRRKVAHKIVEMALNGNVPCLIFTAKNVLYWSDSPPIEETRETEQPALVGTSSGQVVSVVTGEVVTDSTAQG